MDCHAVLKVVVWRCFQFFKQFSKTSNLYCNWPAAEKPTISLVEEVTCQFVEYMYLNKREDFVKLTTKRSVIC